jgi:endonuclease/exonuclease/phosphatase family metal-dependent hydrolase
VVNTYKGEAQDIDVGFWNIEWFNRDYRQKMNDIGRLITKMNLDVWAFEETSPAATRALVDHLNAKYHAAFACAFSEPTAPTDKQTTAVIWNTKTVQGGREQWPSEIDAWFRVDSRNFDELILEAVEGKVFDRYPGLFRFTAKNRREGDAAFDFCVVPLHLKAMAEGSKRRRMASAIIGAAIERMVKKHGKDADWVVGGDYNAELATHDFDKLLPSGMKPISASDERAGAFTYVKKPKSLIDHIFLSANLAKTHGDSSFFVVAHDKTIPDYVQKMSDHRPVLVRLSLRGQTGRSDAPEQLPESLADVLSRLR